LSQHWKSSKLVALFCVLSVAVAVLPAVAGTGDFAGKPDLVRIPVSGQADVRTLVAMGLDITTVRPGQYAEAYLVAGERLEGGRGSQP